MQNLCLFPLGKKQANENDMTRKEIGITISFWDISCLSIWILWRAEVQSALASSVEPVLWKAPAAPLHHCCRASGAVQSQRLAIFDLFVGHPFTAAAWTGFLSVRSFVFCQNLFSGVWLWHCSKAFNKHLNSFPCDKNHGHPSSCLVAVWYFPKRLWDSLLAFLFWNKAGSDVQS